MLAIFGGDVLQLCDTANGNTLAVLQGDRKFQAIAVAFSRDGKKIVTTYQFMRIPYGVILPGREYSGWDIASATKVISYHVVQKREYLCSGLFPRWNHSCCVLQPGVILWDLTKGSLLKTIGTRTLAFYFTFTPSWKLMAVGGDAGGVVLLDPSCGPRMPIQEPYVQGVSSLSFSPDGKRLAATDAMDQCLSGEWCLDIFLGAIVFQPSHFHQFGLT